MTREQLTRLFFRLLKTVPVVELHQAVIYAIRGDRDPMARRPADDAASFSRMWAEQLVDEAERLSDHHSGPPSFPPRA